MRSLFIRFATSALAGPLLASGALAADALSYPRVVGTGENATVEYGPGDHGNIVGGGRVTVVGSGENTESRYHDGQYAQLPHPSMVPVVIGSGENQQVVWVPGAITQTAGSASRVARAPAR